MGQKPSKRYGVKLKDKYLIRTYKHSPKYNLWTPMKSSVEDEIETIESERQERFTKYGRFSWSSKLEKLNAEQELLSYMLKIKNRGLRKKLYRKFANKWEKTQVKTGCKLLLSDIESEVGDALVNTRYGSIGWDIF